MQHLAALSGRVRTLGSERQERRKKFETRKSEKGHQSHVPAFRDLLIHFWFSGFQIPVPPSDVVEVRKIWQVGHGDRIVASLLPSPWIEEGMKWETRNPERDLSLMSFLWLPGFRVRSIPSPQRHGHDRAVRWHSFSQPSTINSQLIALRPSRSSPTCVSTSAA